ncbi:MAG: hypothetical protein MUO89_09110, partial [Dehalococcoidia bacterium]|nr:hypothetical protein [Dehalococcoidia bacterium]
PSRERGKEYSFTLTLTLSLSPYPNGNKSSLDVCPPFLPRERGREGIKRASRGAGGSCLP